MYLIALIVIALMAWLVAYLIGRRQHPCRDNALKLAWLLKSQSIDDQLLLLEEHQPHYSKQASCWPRVLHAALITSTALVSAVFIPGVQIVWTFMGSTVAVLIAYILPAVFYLRIKREHRGADPDTFSKRCMAKLVLGLGLTLAVVCTAMAVVEQVHGEAVPSYCK